MSLEYVFNIGETFEIKSLPRMLAERFVYMIEREDKITLNRNQIAGYLAQFVIANEYKLNEPTMHSRFITHDFNIYDTTVDMKASLMVEPSLIIERRKLNDAQVILLFAVNEQNVMFVGGITKRRIEEDPEAFRLQTLNNKLVYIVKSNELVSIKIDKNGVEEYV